MSGPVNVEIGELVLDGCCEARHADRVVSALRCELERLLALRAPQHGATAQLAGDELRLAAGAPPEQIGRAAARALHRSLVP